MSLRLHNSLSDQKEDFVPLREGRVTLYVCGPTVYNDSHLGHAKTYVSFDVILRYLKYRGFSTFYVQNITDVGHLMGDADEGEDKMLKRARELELEPMPSRIPTPPGIFRRWTGSVSYTQLRAHET